MIMHDNIDNMNDLYDDNPFLNKNSNHGNNDKTMIIKPPVPNASYTSNGTVGSISKTKPVNKHRIHPWKTLFSIIADILILGAILFGSYFFWLQFWTGIESSQSQNQTVQNANWNKADSSKTAAPQTGEPPVQPNNPAYGDFIGQLFIPRFGNGWNRNITQGTDWEQLGRHGLGHYEGKAMAGQIGLFAIAGHVNGYGQPLAQLDTMKDGDYIVVRTQDYWYVYKYESQTVVDKDNREAIADVPFKPYDTPTERLMALTTCDPKYYMGPGETPNRRIAYAKFMYWAKVSDGTPKELMNNDDITASTDFVSNTTNTLANHLPNASNLIKYEGIAYIIVFISALIAWRFKGIKEWHEAYLNDKTVFSVFSWIYRIQPGVKPVRIILTVILWVTVLTMLVAYACPWAVAHIPALQVSAAM